MWRMKVYSIIFTVFFCLLFSHIALAEKRVALVIGNSDYQHISKLSNPQNDAILMRETLVKLGFEVEVATNLSQKGMKVAFANFTRKLKSYGRDTIALVFYAGHGTQVEGVNYLIPVDAKIEAETDFDIHAFAANDLLASLQKTKNRINIIIFDACRDNPFGLSRSGSRGLAMMRAPEGSLISFSSAPGRTAQDGKGENSPFSAALARHILTPGITFERVLKRVGKDVRKVTNNRQRPWWNRDIYDDLYLNPAKASSVENNNKLKDECSGPDKPLTCLGFKRN